MSGYVYLDLALTKMLHSVTSSLYIVNSTLWGLRESPSLQTGGAQTAKQSVSRKDGGFLEFVLKDPPRPLTVTKNVSREGKTGAKSEANQHCGLVKDT